MATNNYIQIKKTLTSTTRENIRKEITGWFLDEKCGTIQQVSRYEYIVEEFLIGDLKYEIYLRRPAFKNKGMDFVISVRRFKKRTFKHAGSKWSYKEELNRPSFESIYELLKNMQGSIDVSAYLKTVYDTSANLDTTTIPDVLVTIRKITNIFEMHLAVAILLFKWFFIEQDCTYWNYSGRELLHKELEENGLL